MDTWKQYMEAEGNKVSRREFEMNLEEKKLSGQFHIDMDFLIRSDIKYHMPTAMDLVLNEIIGLI